MVSILLSIVRTAWRSRPVQGRLRIHNCKNVLFGVAHGPGKSKLCIDVAGDGNNIVLFGAGQLVLGSDDLNVVGRASLKAILGEREFALCKFLPLLSDTDLLGRGIEIQTAPRGYLHRRRAQGQRSDRRCA